MACKAQVLVEGRNEFQLLDEDIILQWQYEVNGSRQQGYQVTQTNSLSLSNVIHVVHAVISSINTKAEAQNYIHLGSFTSN